jgi:EAL and modified HD-GYP domain-containing signal transduction protein
MEQMTYAHPQLQFDNESPERAYMAGILSLLESIYDVAIEEIIVNLNLNDEVAAALLHHSGHYGRLLSVMEHLENLDMVSASAELSSIGIHPNVLPEIQLRAFNWKKAGR